jgi:peptide/nickel transport system ATP-binding protein
MSGPDVTAESSSTSTELVRVDELSVTFPLKQGSVSALRSVSFEMHEREVLAVVGESGSGKTVLSLSLLGLLPAISKPVITGKVEVCGVDMLTEIEAARMVRRRLTGAVFQDPSTSLDPTMRVQRQLTERGVMSEEAIQRLHEAGVPEPERRARQFPHELSGGLRQRVMIAMALCVPESDQRQDKTLPNSSIKHGASPRLIVADEPTTALDVSVQAQILTLFDRLRREHGCALLFITHDLGVAAAIADRIAVFHDGELCELGPAKRVLDDPTHAHTKELLSARLSIDRPSLVRRTPPRDEEASGGATIAESRESSGPTTPCLELRNVSKSFALRQGRFGSGGVKLHAVTDVNLSLPSRGSLALVGESGCGKTTTLRIATGLLKPDSGSVRWASNAHRPQLVFQDAGSSLTPWMTVESQIYEVLARKGVPRTRRRDRIRELLGHVGLDARVGQARPRSLSGGQRQRAAIARALASEPQVLVCDEPVSALDATLVVRVLELLEKLRREIGVALLVVTHDLAVARTIADTVCVMYRGRIVERGPANELFARPAHPYTKGLLAAVPTTEPGRLMPMLMGEPPSAIGEISGCEFHPRCPYRQERCLEDQPPLYDVGLNRESACHFYDEVLNSDQFEEPKPNVNNGVRDRGGGTESYSS